MLSKSRAFLGALCVCALLTHVPKSAHAQRNRSRKGPLLVPVTSSRERKPNIVLILTDDQDVELGSMNFMPKTLRSMRDQGAQFRHAYVTTPMCCPSRSSLLTGMYVHNHNVYTNNDNCSSTQWQATHETRSFATYLSNAGYRTGYFGKYLNKYNGSYIPPGWREWGGLIMNSKYYNYSINMNGKKIKHGFDYHKDYYPDLIANDSIAFLRQSKKNNAHKPVMLTMSFPAPHGPEDSAPQYSHLFFNVTTHHTPSYDYAPNPDKQWILQVTKRMLPIHKQFTDLLMTKRLQTLQSVDSAVQRIIDELDELGELDNTYIVYTSDHGYHLGQFGLIKGKSFPFEFDIRVPFLLRGPGIEPGTVVDDVVLNIDLAPTFLDMAGVEAPPHMDGHSVLPLFNSKRKKMKWPDTFLIESSGRRETPFLDAKLRKAVLSRWSGTTESPYVFSSTEGASTSGFGLSTWAPPKVNESNEDVANTDDDMLEEDGDDLDDDLEEDDEEVDEESDSEDVVRADALPFDNQLLENHQSKFEKIAEECRQGGYQLPCKLNQKWYCQVEDGRWRKHKCKQPVPRPQLSTKTYKKCACFTTEGLVYKKLPVNITTTKRHANRYKRDAEMQEILFGDVSRRQKRDALTHVESVMESVQDKLSDLEAVNSSMHTPMVTNKIPESMPECIVSSNGKVNCPRVVYQDKKTWRRSRHHIDNEIHHLKEKLEKLKEIRRHLKHTKPSDDTDEGNSTDASNNINELPAEFSPNLLLPVDYNVTTERNYSVPPRRKINNEDGQRTSRRRKFNSTTISSASTPGFEEFLNFTTHSPVTHHRHHHHNHHKNQTTTTKVNYDVSTEAPADVRRRKVPVESRIRTQKPKFDTPPPPPPPSTEGPLVDSNINSEYCECEMEEPPVPDAKEIAREMKRKIKEERLKRKLRKQRKKAQMEKECSSERMNCFHHDNDHWRTAPLWTAGPFCFCMNANNNTYSCVRTINSTHNFLYCEFVTGLVTFYNLRIDPFELQNRVDQLRPEERSYLHGQLISLMGCKGRTCSITHNTHTGIQRVRSSVLQTHSYVPQPQRYKKRKLVAEDLGNVARSLPLYQSETHSQPQFGYDSHVTLVKQWRRRKPWKLSPKNRERERRKQQYTNSSKFQSRWV